MRENLYQGRKKRRANKLKVELSLFSQGSSLTPYSCPFQSALYTQSHRSSVKGHHLPPIHVDSSQHCEFEVIARQSMVITYILFTSIPVSTMYTTSSPSSQGSSLDYSCPFQLALCTQRHRSSVKDNHLLTIHVHPSQHLGIIW
jgi:hypothetical protein